MHDMKKSLTLMFDTAHEAIQPDRTDQHDAMGNCLAFLMGLKQEWRLVTYSPEGKPWDQLQPTNWYDDYRIIESLMPEGGVYPTGFYVVRQTRWVSAVSSYSEDFR